MARRNQNERPAEQAEATASETPAQEATAPQAESTTTEATPKASVNLTVFNTTLDEVLEKRDQATGELAPAEYEPVVKVYRELDGPAAKAGARKAVDDRVVKALDDMNVQLARALVLVKQNLTSAKSTGGGEKVPTDPTEAYVQQVVALQFAWNIVTNEQPDGVAEDWQAKVEEKAKELAGDLSTYQAWNGDGDEPDVSPIVKRAAKLAAGKAAGSKSSGTRSTYTGPKRNIEKHIQSALATKQPGEFMSVADIVKHGSTEYEPGVASAGAVSSRLFPKNGKMTLQGIEPVEAGDGHPKGARRVAA